MLSKKVKTRIFLLSLSSIVIAAIIFIVLKSLEKNVVYFLLPSEISNNLNIPLEKKIRIGGLVKENSINKSKISVNFIITDRKNEIIVSYKGLIPNLFAEGKGVVAEGQLKDRKFFVADKILAKHDENYMPPKVYKALEK